MHLRHPALRLSLILALGAGLGSLAAGTARSQNDAPDRRQEFTNGLRRLLAFDRFQASALAARALASPMSPGVMRSLAPRLGDAAQSTANQTADKLVQPGMSVNYSISGGKDFVPEVISGSVKRGTGGFGAAVEVPTASYSVDIDPNSHTLSVTLAVGPSVPLPLGPAKVGVAARKVIKAEFTFTDNKQIALIVAEASARSLGVDGDPVLHFVQRAVESYAGAVPPSQNASEALARRLKLDLLVDAQLFRNVKSFAVGHGWEYAIAPGVGKPGQFGVEGINTYGWLEMERLTPGQEPGQGTRYLESSLGLALAGKTGGHGAQVGMTVTHTTDPTKQEPNEHALNLAARLRSGGVREVTRQAVEATTVFWDHDGVRKGLEALAVAATSKIRGATRIAVQKSKKVGGVMIFYDPALLEAAVPPAELAAAMRELAQNLDAGRTNFAVRVGDTQESFTTLSLRGWLASGARTLGDLTRVRGYILKPDDVILVGQVEAGRPKVDADLLTVALNTSYRTGQPPFVSIDPEPFNPMGKQLPRYGNVPEKYGDSEFVRIMLDADYDMKRIYLGELKLNVPGFESWYDLLQRPNDGEPGMARFWLTPLVAAAGDVLENGPAVIFESRVQVLTERMVQAGQYLKSAGKANPTQEQAAGNLTSYYPQIERELDSFYQLHGLFDITKLCAVWRHKGVKSPLLDAIAKRPVRQVKRRDGKSMLAPYEGIGPKAVPGAFLVIGGGASSNSYLSEGSFVQSEALGALLAGETTLRLERSLPLAAGAHPELLLSSVVQHFAEGEYADCIEKATQALEVSPTFAGARIYRALAYMQMERAQEALADLDRAVAAEPKIRGLRGVVRLRLGDAKGANADVDAAVRAFPDDEAAWTWYGVVKTFTLKPSGVDRAVRELARLNPASEAALDLREASQWLSRMDPAAARELGAHALRLPFDFMEALVQGNASFQAMDFRGAVTHLRKALRLAEKRAQDPSMRAFHGRERVLLLLAYAETAEGEFRRRLSEAGLQMQPGGEEPVKGAASAQPTDSEREPIEERECPAAPAEEVVLGIGRAERLIELHPDWPSGYFVKALCAMMAPEQAPGVDAKAAIDQGLAMKGAADPLLSEWKLIFGEQDIGATLYAQALLVTAMGQKGQQASGDTPGLGSMREQARYLRELKKQPSLTGRLAGAVLELFEALEFMNEPPSAFVKLMDPDIKDPVQQKAIVVRYFRQVERKGGLIGKMAGLMRQVTEKHFDPRRPSKESPPAAAREIEDLLPTVLLAHLRPHAEEASKTRPREDLASLIVYFNFVTTYAGIELGVGDAARAVKAAEAMMVNLPVRTASNETARMAGVLRFGGMGLLVLTHEKRNEQDGELLRLIEAAAKGEVPVARVPARANELVNASVARIQQSQTPLVHEFFRLLFGLVQRGPSVRQAFLSVRDKVEAGTLPQSRRDRVLAHLAAAGEAADEAQMRRMAQFVGLDLLKTMPKSPEAALEALDSFDYFRMFRPLVRKASSSVELHSIMPMFQALGMAFQVLPELLAQQSQDSRAAEILGRMSARMSSSRALLEYEIRLKMVRFALEEGGAATGGAPRALTRNGRTFVPLRYIFEWLGAEVQYNKGVITATRGEDVVRMTVGTRRATINGDPLRVDSPPFIANGKTYVPLRLVAEALGAKVAYEAATRTVRVTAKGRSLQLALAQR